MDLGDAPKLRNLVVAIACTSVFAICTVSVFYFYGLHGPATLYPYTAQSQQTIVILRIALIATILSFLPFWFSIRRKHRPSTSALWSGFGVLIVLVLYGLSGCRGILGRSIEVAGWHVSTSFFFPSLFFSEFNFLTFICEVAPVTAGFTGVIVYSSLKSAVSLKRQ